MKAARRVGTYRREILPSYIERDLLGFPVELIDSVEREICPASNEVNITIPSLPGLIAAACVARVLLPQKLNGKEIKSLRKALELTGKELAELMDVREETISRWENNEPMGPASEKLFRLHVVLRLKDKVILKISEKGIQDIIERQIEPIRSPDDGKPLIQLMLEKRGSQRRPEEDVWKEPQEEKKAA